MTELEKWRILSRIDLGTRWAMICSISFWFSGEMCLWELLSSHWSSSDLSSPTSKVHYSYNWIKLDDASVPPPLNTSLAWQENEHWIRRIPFPVPFELYTPCLIALQHFFVIFKWQSNNGFNSFTVGFGGLVFFKAGSSTFPIGETFDNKSFRTLLLHLMIILSSFIAVTQVWQ